VRICLLDALSLAVHCISSVVKRVVAYAEQAHGLFCRIVLRLCVYEAWHERLATPTTQAVCLGF